MSQPSIPAKKWFSRWAEGSSVGLVRKSTGQSVAYCNPTTTKRPISLPCSKDNAWSVVGNDHLHDLSVQRRHTMLQEAVI